MKIIIGSHDRLNPEIRDNKIGWYGVKIVADYIHKMQEGDHYNYFSFYFWLPISIKWKIEVKVYFKYYWRKFKTLFCKHDYVLREAFVPSKSLYRFEDRVEVNRCKKCSKVKEKYKRVRFQSDF